jgi:hypothetical protein
MAYNIGQMATKPPAAPMCDRQKTHWERAVSLVAARTSFRAQLVLEVAAGWVWRIRDEQTELDTSTTADAVTGQRGVDGRVAPSQLRLRQPSDQGRKASAAIWPL